jgi:chemotaxis protein methyltransferase CheR
VTVADVELALSDRDLGRIVRLVYDRSGITLHEGKRSLVVARLQKRLRANNFTSFGAYIKHVEDDPGGEEIVALLDAIATNHTYFFREEQHFELLVKTVTEWQAQHLPQGGGRFRIWSAASSTGEENYTMTMTLLDRAPGLDFSIMGSDISTKALAAAKAGVYKMAGVQGLPRDVLKKHFEKGLGPQEGLARVSAEIRRRNTFRHLNLLEITDLGERYEVIFCRNVMIYFDKPTQQRLVERFAQLLKPAGLFFAGHAESLLDQGRHFRLRGQTVYQLAGPGRGA